MVDETDINGLDSDREPPLLNQRTGLGTPLIIALFGGAFVLAWGLFGPKKKDVAPTIEQQVQQVQTTPSTAGGVRNLPTITDPEPEPETVPVVRETEVQKPRAKTAYELERERRLQEEALRQLREKEAAEKARKASIARRIKSPMLILNEGQAPTQVAFITEDSGGLSGETQGITGQSASSGNSNFGGFGAGSQGAAPENEILSNKNERFLRDGRQSAVETIEATRLTDLDYKLTQGTTIDGILETAVNTQVAGLIRAMVSDDVYSRTGSHVLLPRGTRLIGKYQNGIARGQARVFVIWTRAERPDGIVIDLASYGSDPLGRAGLSGKVDTHFFKRFGASALLSIVGAGVIIAADDNDSSIAEREVIRDSGRAFNRSAEIALENSINIPPTIKIKQGTKLTVFVSKDLSFKLALSGQ